MGVERGESRNTILEEGWFPEGRSELVPGYPSKMKRFNCIYCAAPGEGRAGWVYSCPRCGKSQNVPDPPLFFFPFTEPELALINRIMKSSAEVVSNPGKLWLDIATERTLKDITSGLASRLAGMTGGGDEALLAVVEDAPSIGMHGYAVGRALIGTLDAKRDLKSIVRYSSVPDFSSRLRLLVQRQRQKNILKSQQGAAVFCLDEARRRWSYHEIEARRLGRWSAVLSSEIDRMTGDGFILAIVEEGEYQDAREARTSTSPRPALPLTTPSPAPPPQVTRRAHTPPPPSPAPARGAAPSPPGSAKDTSKGKSSPKVFFVETAPEVADVSPARARTPGPTPPPGVTSTSRIRVSSGLTSFMPAYVFKAPAAKTPTPGPTQVLGAISATGGDKYIECEYWVSDGKGKFLFSGYRFYDLTGNEIPKDKYLRQGAQQEKDGKPCFTNALNLTQFLKSFGGMIGMVKHVTDPESGLTEIFCDTVPGARPLREFYTEMEKA